MLLRSNEILACWYNAFCYVDSSFQTEKPLLDLTYTPRGCCDRSTEQQQASDVVRLMEYWPQTMSVKSGLYEMLWSWETVWTLNRESAIVTSPRRYRDRDPDIRLLEDLVKLRRIKALSPAPS